MYSLLSSNFGFQVKSTNASIPILTKARKKPTHAVIVLKWRVFSRFLDNSSSVSCCLSIAFILRSTWYSAIVKTPYTIPKISERTTPIIVALENLVKNILELRLPITTCLLIPWMALGCRIGFVFTFRTHFEAQKFLQLHGVLSEVKNALSKLASISSDRDLRVWLSKFKAP